MDDLSDDDRRSNLCVDVVAETRLEPGLAHLLRQPAGTWVALNKLYEISSAAGDKDFPCLGATWLPAPRNSGPDSVLVIFCDAESQWSTIAYYYAAEKLLQSHSADPTTRA